MKSNSFFVKFKTVGEAGFVRANLDSKTVFNKELKVQFVCSPKLKNCFQNPRQE